MSHAADAHGEEHHDEHHDHVVPLGLLAGVLGILLFLTIITVVVSELQLGEFALLAALVIAAVKVTFVVLYFMHLRWDSPFNVVALVISLAFVALFIGLTILDTADYRPNIREALDRDGPVFIQDAPGPIVGGGDSSGEGG